MRRRVLASVVLLVILSTVVALSNPVRWPPELIRSWLLRQAPVGSSFADVQTLVTKKRWASHDGWGGESFRHVKGIHWLEADVNYRGFPLPVPCRFSAMWGFDNEKLVDLRVEKGCDLL